MSDKKNENFYNTLKENVSGAFRKLRAANVFVLLVSMSFAVYLLYYTIVGQAEFVDVFYRRCTDLFMDFFNSVRDASQGAAVYTDRKVIYPPMANLIYLWCSRFCPSPYNSSDWYNRLSWSEYAEAVIFVVLLTLALCLLLFAMVYEKVDGGRKTKFFFAFFAIFNMPMLYMLERGNMILFCLIALMFYAFTYNSPSKLHRELGLIALAFAFSLKLYPAVFGYFLLVDKRFKEAIRCAVYGLLMLIIPSFFFGGPSCLIQIVKNITSFSVDGINSLSVISGYSGIPMPILNMLAYLWCAVCAISFLIAPFVFREKRWKVWMLGIATVITIPSLTVPYMWTFFLIPMILLSNLGKLTAKDSFFFGVMSSMFLFTVLRFNYYLTVNALIMFPLTAIISITAVTDTAVQGVRLLKKIKKSRTEAA